MPEDASPPQSETPDEQADRGLYPKFHVARIDGRDRPGGDREDSSAGYFVLDTVYDPLARAAYALYAALAERAGYTALAADMRSNLRVLGAVVEEQQQQDEPKIRAVATWTYPAPDGHAYVDQIGWDASKALSTAEKAALDLDAARENEIGLADFDGWADRGSLDYLFLADL